MTRMEIDQQRAFAQLNAWRDTRKTDPRWVALNMLLLAAGAQFNDAPPPAVPQQPKRLEVVR